MPRRSPLLAVLLALFSVSPATAGDDDGLAGGIIHFRQGDYDGAVRLIEPWRASHPDDLDAALLLGISYYHLGRRSLARDLLARAAAGPDDDTRNAARTFLGVMAAQDGDLDRAADLLRLAAGTSSPELAHAGQLLLEQNVPGILHLAVMAGSGYDSNVPRLPGALVRMPGTSAGDANLAALAAVAARPFRSLGLTLEDNVVYRRQLRLSDFDWFGNTIGAGYSGELGRLRTVLGYGFEVMTLGGALYAWGHAAQLRLACPVGGGTGLAANYELRDRAYQLADYAPYSGPTHRGMLSLTWRSARGAVDVSAGYLVARELTEAPELVAFGQGGQLAFRMGLGEAADVLASGAAVWKSFDAGGRADRLLSADASVSVQLASHVALIAGGTATRNLSTSADFDYTKLTAHVDLRVDWSLY